MEEKIPKTCRSVLQCVAVYGSVLQCVSVCCSVSGSVVGIIEERNDAGVYGPKKRRDGGKERKKGEGEGGEKEACGQVWGGYD